MNKIEVTLKMCTLYNGVPFGPALIRYDSDKKTMSKNFEGIGIFTNGQLHMSPFLCQMGDGTGPKKKKRRLYTHMIDGRPAEKHFGTYFFEEGA